MGEEGVLAVPAFPVAGVERVDVDVAPVVVGRRAGSWRREAVTGLAAVRQTSEEMVVATAVDPVRPRFENGERAGPVRQVQLPRTEPPARSSVEVRQRATPRLHGPVRTVGRGAAGDEEGEGGSVV